MTMRRRVRDLPGVLVHDLGRYRRALSHSGPDHLGDPRGWISLCNRAERLIPEGRGMRPDWTWGSALHAPQILTGLGRNLFEAAFGEWPIKFADEPSVCSDQPVLSFVFAHSGSERLPQLVKVLRAVFAQEDVPCEVVVVDQSPQPLLGALPMPITYRHLDKTGVAPGWHKSWAYNVGARVARGKILVFHDGDICPPAGYARELWSELGSGEQAAASLQRLLFYLDPRDTGRLLGADRIDGAMTPQLVFQNWKGGTIAVRRDAFLSVGGFDEGFVDWGGEDDEFYDRCAAIGHCRSGYLPFVHLWHPQQASKDVRINRNTGIVLPARLAITPAERIGELDGRAWGCARAPDPAASYASMLPEPTIA